LGVDPDGGDFSAVKKNLTAVSVGSLISAIILIYGNLLPWIRASIAGARAAQ